MRHQYLAGRAWLLSLLAGAAVIGAYLAVGAGANEAAALYTTASIGSTAAIGITVGRHRRTRQRGWTFIALGFVAYAAGDFAWCLHDVLGFTGVPPRLEDAFYLACYPLFVAGLFGLSLSGRQLLETSVRQLLDAALIFVSAFCARSWLSSFSYWAATTVTPLSVAAVSCGDVVVHVTVEPAVSVVHVYVFGPPT
jgi:hypothetical protein